MRMRGLQSAVGEIVLYKTEGFGLVTLSEAEEKEVEEEEEAASFERSRLLACTFERFATHVAL